MGAGRRARRPGVPPQVPALTGGGAADEGRRLARGYSFRIKRISPRASQERFPGGWRRHKLPIPRRRQKGTGSLIPLLLLFPPQNSLRWEPCDFPPDALLETTKGGLGPLWKPLFGDGRGCFFALGRGTEDEGGVPAVMQGVLGCGRRGLGWPGRSRSGVGCSSTVGAGLCPRPVFRG